MSLLSGSSSLGRPVAVVAALVLCSSAAACDGQDDSAKSGPAASSAAKPGKSTGDRDATRTLTLKDSLRDAALDDEHVPQGWSEGDDYHTMGSQYPAIYCGKWAQGNGCQSVALVGEYPVGPAEIKVLTFRDAASAAQALKGMVARWEATGDLAKSASPAVRDVTAAQTLTSAKGDHSVGVYQVATVAFEISYRPQAGDPPLTKVAAVQAERLRQALHGQPATATLGPAAP